MRKSAQGTDSKRFAGDPVFERVRKRLKRKKIVKSCSVKRAPWERKKLGRRRGWDAEGRGGVRTALRLRLKEARGAWKNDVDELDAHTFIA